MSKLTAVIATTLGLAMALPAQARDWHEGHWDYARVISAIPVYREVRVSEPREVCREEPVTERTVYRGAPDPGAVLLGGIIGGVIGHQFGHGSGRDFSTAAGAMIGAGHAAATSSYGNGQVVERDVYQTSCRDVRDTRYERRIDEYDVTYRYHGRDYHTRLPYDPGSRVRVRVDVSPEYGDDLN